MSSSSGGLFSSVLSRDKGLRQSQLTSTPTNLLSSSSRSWKECVLPPAMCCRRRLFAMMHLRNFCQVSIQKVRQVMTRAPVKSSVLDWNSERRRRLKIGDNWSYASPVKNFCLRHCSAVSVWYVRPVRGEAKRSWSRFAIDDGVATTHGTTSLMQSRYVKRPLRPVGSAVHSSRRRTTADTISLSDSFSPNNDLFRLYKATGVFLCYRIF